jgi:ferric-dicitrate binding protein FerR (iron transport regulator)
MIPERKSTQPIAALEKPAAKNFDRHILLPDSSIVVLKSGSTLHIIADFKGAERKTELIGEAYFEITKDNKRPFVIITGKVKTTVLGTAFDIRAWPAENKVIVSVTTGKVRVEDHKKVLALLTANQQIKYDIANSEYSQSQVDAGKLVADWASKDLIFKGETMGQIAEVLSKRYDVDIVVTDPDVAATQIVSAFEATEPLDSILDIICSLNNNARFKREGKQIIISHK